MAPTELLAEQHERTLRRLSGGKDGEGPLRIGLLTASVARSRAAALREAAAAGELDLADRHPRAAPGRRRVRSPGLRRRRRAAPLRRAPARGPRREGARPGPASARDDGDADPAHARPHRLRRPRRVGDRRAAARAPAGADGRAARRRGRAASMQQIRATLARGEQVYVVYPLVEETERSDLRAASESAERIAAVFPEVAIGPRARASARRRRATRRWRASSAARPASSSRRR